MVESDYLILVADDEEDIVEMLSYNLTHEGFSVLKAYTGKSSCFGIEISSASDYPGYYAP